MFAGAAGNPNHDDWGHMGFFKKLFSTTPKPLDPTEFQEIHLTQEAGWKITQKATMKSCKVHNDCYIDWESQ